MKLSQNEKPFWILSQKSEYSRIFQVTGANQNAQKLLSTDLVNTILINISLVQNKSQMQLLQIEEGSSAEIKYVIHVQREGKEINNKKYSSYSWMNTRCYYHYYYYLITMLTIKILFTINAFWKIYVIHVHYYNNMHKKIAQFWLAEKGVQLSCNTTANL